MTKIRQLHASPDDGLTAQRREQRRSEFLAAQGDDSMQRSGFSARLNMLCSLAGERKLNNGRLEDIAALDPSWERAVVKGWLCDDRLPTPPQLRGLVRFFVGRLQDNSDATLWEAHLIYGQDVIGNPALQSKNDQPGSLLPLAARELLSITNEHGIPPGDYDAREAIARIIEMLEQLNFRSSESKLQPGHRLIIASSLFPDAVTL